MGQHYRSMDVAYRSIYDACHEGGSAFEHRGARCIELRPFDFTILEPSHALFTGVRRRMNYRFWAAETLMYMAGWGSMHMPEEQYQLLTTLNSNYEKFSRRVDGRSVLNPMVCYGDGFGPGLPRAYETLNGGISRRQALVPIWDRDTPHSYEESPCMVGMQFFVERLGPKQEPRVSALAWMRSNDLNWGVPYDVATMCAIQIAMAGALGLPTGSYHHMATSMHYYENGNLGEGPPPVSPHHEERWLVSPPRMPDPPVDLNMQELQAAAHHTLVQLHLHLVVNGAKAHSFKCSMEANEPWVRQWCDVIRWSWLKEGHGA